MYIESNIHNITYFINSSLIGDIERLMPDLLLMSQKLFS